jgi:hypothetical protein
LWGFGRSTVTATSIISDSIWATTLQEIWCNDDGDPGKAFWVKRYDRRRPRRVRFLRRPRHRRGRADRQVHRNAGLPERRWLPLHIIAPMLDGQPPHGFEVDGSLNVVSNNPTMGLREVVGTDPQSDSFSLGQGTPQVWGPQRAAGTAFVEIRRYRSVRHSALDHRSAPDAGADLAGAHGMDLGPER